MTALSKETESQAYKNEEEEIEEEVSHPIGCGILGRYPIISVVSFAALGVALGIGLAAWTPDDDDDAKDVLIKWIGLVGDMFIRSLSKYPFIVMRFLIVSLLHVLTIIIQPYRGRHSPSRFH